MQLEEDSGVRALFQPWQTGGHDDDRAKHLPNALDGQDVHGVAEIRLFDGFSGKLTTTKWAKLEKCSHDTALRDIQDLLEQGLLHEDPGGGRSTSYSLVDA